MTRNRHLAILTIFGVISTALAPEARASSADEFLELMGDVDPNIVFLLDLSEEMGDPCALDTLADTDTASSGGADTAVVDEDAGSMADAPCMVMAIDAIRQISMHYEGARFGVVGTAEAADDSGFRPIIPVGSPATEFSSGLHGLMTSPLDTRNLAESLSSLADTYFSNSDTDDLEDDDGDGFSADWEEAPIQYACQETHVIVLTRGRPVDDEDPLSSYIASISPDVLCDEDGEDTTDSQCYYDNAVYSLYNTDFRADLSGDQNVIVHTIAIGASDDEVVDDLFSNATDLIDGAGMYTIITDPEEILSTIMTVLRDIRSGTYSRSSPVVSADGSYLIYGFYEIDADNPLAEGHVRAYEIEDDPTSPNYGQVLYDGPDEYGGAIWDAGDLLVSRPVTSSESNPDDRDGFGKRDIYTFFEPAALVMATEADSDHRMGLDYEFVQAVSTDEFAMLQILKMDVTRAPPCADDKTYDLNDDCLVDEDDLQALVDFVRGLPEATYRYLDMERGTWKLGDSPHSVPVVVSKRNNAFTVDPTYRTFLKEMEASDYPDIVLIAANDGMLHAFALEDDTSTLDSEEGEELWAWIPGQLLYRDQDPAWAGRLIDLMLYGRTFLFDGTPVVEDVWIDADDDNTKDCTDLDNCEWRRVVVVQQGKGGAVTLALDITNPTSPQFLWEQTDDVDTTAMGYTISTPVIANIYDKSGDDPDEWHDRWVAMWGSGRAVPWGIGESNYESAESNIYMWHVGDDYWGTATVGYRIQGDNGHPESDLYSSSLDSDGDDHYEYGYISGALAVVDVDSDGDADTVYFPVTASYTPTDEGGSGPGDTQDPGATWMYKACIPGRNPDNLRWIEFYDPVDDSDGAIAKRPEVYYAATTAWLADGSLGVYWGTGSPYDRDFADPGYLFAVQDADPGSCTSDTMTPISSCGANGVVELDSGEGLTGSPTVYAGVLYFSTWAPASDVCDGGEGRVYALGYDDCAAAIDLNEDDAVTEADMYTTVDGYPSSVTVTDMGTVMVGTATPDMDSGDPITVIKTTDNLLYVSQTLAWMEVL